jgi:hypothetical protein
MVASRAGSGRHHPQTRDLQVPRLSKVCRPTQRILNCDLTESEPPQARRMRDGDSKNLGKISYGRATPHVGPKGLAIPYVLSVPTEGSNEIHLLHFVQITLASVL